MSRIIEVQNRRNTLEKSEAELMAKIATLTIGTPEYDAAARAYLSTKARLDRIPHELLTAKQEDNAEAISRAKEELVSAIDGLRTATGIESLIGESLLTLVFTAGKPESEPGKGDAIASTVVFNPKRIGNRCRVARDSLSEEKGNVTASLDLGTISGVKMSPKVEGKRVRTDWVERIARLEGISLDGHGKRYCTEAGRAVAIAFANELDRIQLTDRWFLGIRDEPTDIVVLLCKDLEGNLYDFVLPFDKLAPVWKSLSRSTGQVRQVKFHIRRTGGGFLLLNPGGGEPLNVTQYESNYRPLKRT